MNESFEAILYQYAKKYPEVASGYLNISKLANIGVSRLFLLHFYGAFEFAVVFHDFRQRKLGVHIVAIF